MAYFIIKSYQKCIKIAQQRVIFPNKPVQKGIYFDVIPKFETREHN
jgi:hypothetical protein